MKIRVEFFGVPRSRAGCAEAEIDLEGEPTLGRLLAAVAARYPDLAAECLQGAGADCRLIDSYVCNLDGEQFVHDPATTIRAGQAVMILAADAGG